MYQTHFGISENPFSITPDPRFLYMSPRYQEALAHLLYGISEAGGFVLLTGEVGTGKTTTCRCLLEQLPDRVDVALVLNPKLSELELLSTICDELGVISPIDRNSAKAFYDQLNGHLLNAHAEGRRSVLIIDEAQNLAPEVIEQVRLLTNLETATTKLLQIILVGQPELNDILSQPSMRQVAQRITARFHLYELEPEETRAYVAHRLQVSGLSDEVFTDQSIDVIHRYSRGIPRLVNSICDRCLLGAYTRNSHEVDHNLATLAASEVLGLEAVPEARRASDSLQRQDNPKPGTTTEAEQAAAATAAAQDSSAPSMIGLTLSFLCAIIVGGALVLFDPFKLDLVAEETRQNALAKMAAVVEAWKPAKPSSELAQEDSPQQPTGMSATDSTDSDAPSPAAAPPAIGVIDQTFVAAPGSRQAALQDLFSIWDVTLPVNDAPDPCDTASGHGLKCFTTAGSFGAIEAMNRPVIIALANDFPEITKNPADLARPYYAVVTGFDGTMVTLKAGDETFSVSRRGLMPYWDRSVLMLWQPPPFYSRDLTVEMEGQDVAWVKVRLAGLNDETPVARTVATFDAALEEAIRAFQKANQLPLSGVIGPETLMKLRDKTENRTVPVLQQPETMAAPLQSMTQGAN